MFNPENDKIFEQFSRKYCGNLLTMWDLYKSVLVGRGWWGIIFLLLQTWISWTEQGDSCQLDHPSLSTNLNILATNVPPCLRTCVVMFRAARSSWAWIYSSISWRPVTSGAPSQTTRSAEPPSNSETILLAVESLVMSPCSWMTPGRGAMACRSTATILTSSLSISGLLNYEEDLISNFSSSLSRYKNFVELKWLWLFLKK